MRIGLISDVHANLPALKAVLKDMPSIDLLMCAGDILGYYPDVNEVCDLLREKRVAAIQGNHDAYITGRMIPEPKYQSAFRTNWTRQRLRPDNFNWLKSLPVEMLFSFGNKTIRLRHANPWDEMGYIYENSDSLLRKIKLPPKEYLFLGHTHHPMIVKCGKGFVINPGSVGQPRDYNPKPSYAVFDPKTGRVVLKRTGYDFPRLQKRLMNLGWDAKSISILSRTRRGFGLKHLSASF